MSVLSKQLLSLEGTYNLRELGGYVSKEGRILQKKKLLRSDMLNRLTPRDEEFLLSYGVRTIIDLRTKEEVEREPDTLQIHPLISYYSVPFLDQMLSNDRKSLAYYNLQDVYIAILEETKSGVKKVIEIIADSLENGVLFHCAAGKDRTGLISMFLLSILGVEKETIIEDYSWSANLMEPRFIEQKQQLMEMGFEAPDFLFSSNREVLMKTLEYLEKKYDGPLAYLQQIGVSKEVINNIQHYLLLGVEVN